MARIFSINFKHDGAERNALVSVRNTPFHTEYTLSNLHDELHDLLPSNKILSPSTGHFIFANHHPDHRSELINEIIRAVSEHVQEMA